MSRRTNRPWPVVIDPVHVTFFGPFSAIERLAWSLPAHQAEPVYLQPRPDGQALLGLTVDESYAEYCRVLAKRAHVHTRRAASNAGAALPRWTLADLTVPAPTPQALRTGLAPLPDGWYVVVDTPTCTVARSFRGWLHHSYAARYTVLTYLETTAEFAKTLRRAGYQVRPAYGVPHDHLSLHAVQVGPDAPILSLEGFPISESLADTLLAHPDIQYGPVRVWHEPRPAHAHKLELTRFTRDQPLVPHELLVAWSQASPADIRAEWEGWYGHGLKAQLQREQVVARQALEPHEWQQQGQSQVQLAYLEGAGWSRGIRSQAPRDEGGAQRT